jgi:hypothetical protein
MKWIFLLFAMPLFLHAADDDAEWSKPVHDLRARLVISPLKRGEDNRDHFVLSFQLERKSHGQLMEVAYTPDRLVVKVIDEEGKEIPWNSIGGNRLLFPWKPLLLPSGASLTFPIAGSLWGGSGQYLGEHIYFDSSFNEWMLPPHGTKTFYLTGEFTIPDQPRDFSNLNFVWGGKLVLPKVVIPKIP